ncbi:DUF1553 domain-containing protein [Singulisphaera sp. Ch08]|uniref:DUF1553 domain-containing protein n=1 Tax=Singulisphaera sp. Ch08 TaxID=3120278 RepID=A0AAU7C8D5_9BACT
MRNRWWVSTLALALSIVLGLTTKTVTAAPPPAVDFSRDVLPILSDKCFRCHGPDAGARKADLRLDLAEGALRKKDPVIVPGQSHESELIVRIKSDDADETMPPPKSNLTLSPREVTILERWVDQGAEWGKHWAFVSPRRQAVPRTEHHDRARNGIDLHVLARLEQENLPPAQEATKETLIRRVTLDLTGLPPTVTEIDAFTADPAPDAYERVVDRLLASPRYGERMATHWLDLARYADTHGYQSDRYRAMWPWRDWVVRSFNGNQPFDEFLTWQLAGDLLPHATKEQRLATAFNRLHMQNEEGGVVEEEFRVAYVVDRVNTMATAFLGLTFECARCHDHKYDPITQRDFYALYAFFQNIDESGQTSYFTPAMPVPTLLLSDEATDQKIADLERRITAKEAELRLLRDQTRSDFQTWLTARPEEPALPRPAASFSFDEIKDGKLTNSADPSKPASESEGPKLVPGPNGSAVELNGENGFTFPGVGHFSRVDPFSISLNLQAPAVAARFVVLHHSKAPIDAGSRGYEVLLESGRVAVGLHHMWPGNSLKVVTKEPIPSGPWVHLAVTYDGSSRADGVRVYINGVAASLEVIRDGLVKDITYEGGEPDLTLGFRFRDNGFKGGRVDDLRIDPRVLTPLDVAHLAGRADLTAAWTASNAQLTAEQREELLGHFLARVDPVAQKQEAELHALRLEHSRLVNPIPEAMVMAELPRPKPAFVLKRGAYDAPGDPVTAGTPATLPPFPSDEPRNRLGLAHWLLKPEHPLTARVTVNRLWQMMFGAGIVETSDNFGSQGAQPTQPELLDWLALEFIDSGWDVKQLLRLMATSSTYRQSSKTGPDLLARDPQNQWLARGPARRLTAEMLRDQALASSGLLTEWHGGPSVKPYQPEGLWEVAMGNKNYNQSKGPDLYRRSLYTFWKRTVPHPAMIAFDAAERNVCVVRRQSTSTPLQALTLLNDEQIVEAARHLGQRMLKEAGTSDRERVAWLFRLITGRQPVGREIAVLEQLLVEQRAIFGSDPKAAEALLAVGESKSDPAINPVELAAGTVLAEAILNHDAAVLRR